MTNTLTDLSSVAIQHYTDAARREAAIDRLYADALAQGQAMEEAGIDIDEFAAHEYEAIEARWLGRKHGQWCHEDCECNAPYDADPSPEEQLEIEAYEATRYARWTALDTEQQDTIIEASEHEAALRYDVTGGRY